MKVERTWIHGISLEHVRGGMYKHLDWDSHSIKGLRFTAQCEDDKELLMVMSSEAGIPVNTETDSDGIVTAYYIELAYGATGKLGSIE